jgi:hypothetical protein
MGPGFGHHPDVFPDISRFDESGTNIDRRHIALGHCPLPFFVNPLNLSPAAVTAAYAFCAKDL